LPLHLKGQYGSAFSASSAIVLLVWIKLLYGVPEFADAFGRRVGRGTCRVETAGFRPRRMRRPLPRPRQAGK
jgi:hypothetical protein